MSREKELALLQYSEQPASCRRWLASAAYDALRPLNAEYPNFTDWYKGLFSSHEALDEDREMLLCLSGKAVAGVAILKHSEKKVCTLRVRKGFRGQSIGTKLLTSSFDLLETSRPLITVRSTRLKEYQRLFERFGFKMEDRRYAYYSLLHSECAFNGVLDERVPLVNTVEFLRAKGMVVGDDCYGPAPLVRGLSLPSDCLVGA